VQIFPAPLHEGLGTLGDVVIQARLGRLGSLGAAAQRCRVPVIAAENPTGEEVVGAGCGSVVRSGSTALEDQAKRFGALSAEVPGRGPTAFAWVGLGSAGAAGAQWAA
jgi:hypothetical protein